MQEKEKLVLSPKYDKRMMFTVIVFTAICLRAPITTVGAVLHVMVNDLTMPSAVAGSITTLPVLMMAFASPLVARGVKKYSLVNLLIVGLLLLLCGIIIRSSLGIGGVFLGTAIIGVGITFGNVLIPSIIKDHFPEGIGFMTGIFTVTMSLCSGIGSGLSVPLCEDAGLGWRNTFIIWVVPVLLALWFASCYEAKFKDKWREMRAARKVRRSLEKERILVESLEAKEKYGMFDLVRNPFAWWVSLLFGGQSVVFFMLSTWLPALLMEKSISPEMAGVVTMFFQLSAIPVNFLAPTLCQRFKNYKTLLAGSALLTIGGLLLLLVAEGVPVASLAAAAISMGVGGVFSLTLAMYGIKTGSGAEAARLSSFSQFVGYIMAAVGPFAAGFIHDMTGTYQGAIWLGVGIMALDLVAGLVVGGEKSHL